MGKRDVERQAGGRNDCLRRESARRCPERALDSSVDRSWPFSRIASVASGSRPFRIGFSYLRAGRRQSVTFVSRLHRSRRLQPPQNINGISRKRPPNSLLVELGARAEDPRVRERHHGVELVLREKRGRRAEWLGWMDGLAASGAERVGRARGRAWAGRRASLFWMGVPERRMRRLQSSASRACAGREGRAPQRCSQPPRSASVDISRHGALPTGRALLVRVSSFLRRWASSQMSRSHVPGLVRSAEWIRNVS